MPPSGRRGRRVRVPRRRTARASCSAAFSSSVTASTPRPRISRARSRRCAPSMRDRCDAARADRAVDRDGRGAVPGGSISVPRPRCSNRCSTPRTLLVRRRTNACSTGGPPRSTARRSSRPVSNGRPFTDGSRRAWPPRLRRTPGPHAAGYWLAAAARGAGDLERALNEATAGVGPGGARARWRRGAPRRSRSAGGRRGSCPIARRACRAGDHAQALAGMVGEWEAFKAGWTR